MCFSPEASFLASAGLSGVGVASAAVTTHRGKILAAIPFLFALQQAAEGAQWIALANGTVNTAAAYFFILFAFLIWPVYVPLAVYILDIGKRDLMRFFVGLGALVSLAFLLALLTHSLDVSAFEKSVYYGLDVPWGTFGISLYVCATVGSLVCSSITAFRWFGVIVFGLFLAAYTLYSATFVSVWCFFASLLSVLIFLYIWKYENRRARAHQISQ